MTENSNPIFDFSKWIVQKDSRQKRTSNTDSQKSLIKGDIWICHIDPRHSGRYDNFKRQSFRHNGSHFVTRFHRGLTQKRTSNLESWKILIKGDIWIMVLHFGTKASHFVKMVVISSQGLRRALGKNGPQIWKHGKV